jgi:hypothetical protein
MNAYNYIVEKQIQWALNHGIELIGSKYERGRRTYTRELNQNLFVHYHNLLGINLRKAMARKSTERIAILQRCRHCTLHLH